MTARKLDRIRSLSLAKIDISPQCRNAMAGWVLDRPAYNLGREAAEPITVGRAMDHAESNEISHSRITPWDFRNFRRWLVSQGLDYFDWRLLPPISAAGRLSKMKKGEILAADVRVLSTLSNYKVLGLISDTVGKPIKEVTVADLIARVTYPDFQQGTRDCRQSFFATRDLLWSLGFGYGDGNFFRIGTREHQTSQLQLKYRLSKKAARGIVDIAARESWLKFPVG
jgi:hypothetical protein